MPLKLNDLADITLDYRVGEKIENITPDSVIVQTKYLLLEVRSRNQLMIKRKPGQRL